MALPPPVVFFIGSSVTFVPLLEKPRGSGTIRCLFPVLLFRGARPFDDVKCVNYLVFSV